MVAVVDLPVCYIFDVMSQVCSHTIVLGISVVRGGNKDYIQVVAIERVTNS